jgi:DNA-binding NarL/FixJ family response regulator
VLVLTSCGNLDSDISNIGKVRIAAPGVRIVMFGGTGAEREFLQYVRAGIRGYLLLGASVKGMGGIGSSACRESILSKYALRIVVQLF